MRVSAVSGDLLVKLALIAAGVGLALYLVRRSTGAVSGAVAGAVESVQEFADSVIVGVNPYNPGNWANEAVTVAGNALVSDTGPGRNADGSWSLGGAIYDLFNPDPVGQMVFEPKRGREYAQGGPSMGVYGVMPPNTGGATGYW